MSKRQAELGQALEKNLIVLKTSLPGKNAVTSADDFSALYWRHKVSAKLEVLGKHRLSCSIFGLIATCAHNDLEPPGDALSADAIHKTLIDDRLLLCHVNLTPEGTSVKQTTVQRSWG